MGILQKGDSFAVLAPYPKQRKEKEAKNQRQASHCKKSALSKIADTRSYNSVWQDALSFYTQPSASDVSLPFLPL